MPELDEIDVMKRMGEMLEQLGDEARLRALGWANSKFGLTAKDLPRSAPATVSGAEDSIAAGRFSSFAELFDAAQPTGDREKALVAAYWAQACSGQENYPSQMLNDQLKDLGHRVSNITEALTRLKSEKPALILQLKKSGTSKQARKTYKLSQEGIRRVQQMIGE